MMEEKRLIYGVLLTNRMVEAPRMALLASTSCHVRVRLGLHNVDASYCSAKGLVWRWWCRKAVRRRRPMEGVEVQSIS